MDEEVWTNGGQDDDPRVDLPNLSAEELQLLADRLRRWTPEFCM